MKYILLFAILIASCFCQATFEQPLPPVWPNRWAQDYVETWNITNTYHRNVGTYFYDYTSNTHRLSRSNGQFDSLCKSLTADPAECDQVIVDNKRFIFYPETNQCCYCCGANEGCGVLKPQWFIDPIYLGRISYFGVDAFSWVIYEDANEQSPNYYYETTEEDPTQRVLLYLARQNYQQNYLLESRRTNFANITLPESCKANILCPGTCAKVRPQQQA